MTLGSSPTLTQVPEKDHKVGSLQKQRPRGQTFIRGVLQPRSPLSIASCRAFSDQIDSISDFPPVRWAKKKLARASGRENFADSPLYISSV
jgi:hypothetical protein